MAQQLIYGKEFVEDFAAQTAVLLPPPNYARLYYNGTALVCFDSAGNQLIGTGTGGVTSITGTANQITVTGTTTPTLSLSSTLIAPGTVTVPQAGALSQAALSITGTPVTGGTSTTTFPLVYLNSGAAPTAFSTSGTIFGINAPSGFSGNLFDVFVNGASRVFRVTSTGALDTPQTGTFQNSVFGNLVTKYNNINTASNGVPSIYASVDLTGQVAAKVATTLFTPTSSGMYRLNIYEKVTTAASISSVLGGATGTTITYTDGTDSVAQSVVVAMQTETGANAKINAGNATSSVLSGSLVIFAKTGVAIQYAIDYTSSGTGMAYEAHLKLEAL